MDNLKAYREYFDNMGSLNYFGRLGKTFMTQKNYYYYDMGTGKVARVNKNVYIVLKVLTEDGNFKKVMDIGLTEEELLATFKEIKLGVEKENILSARPLNTLTGSPVLELEENLENKLSSLLLEVTEKCNLRCKYCIYNSGHSEFRNFGHKDMDFDIAKKAIDFVLKHSSQTEDEVVVDFMVENPYLILG